MNTPDHKPPSLARWLASKFIDDGYLEEFFGDLQEIYSDRITTKGRVYANLMYWVDTFHLLFGFSSIKLFRNQTISTTMYMIEYVFKMAFRNLRKSKLFSVINIAGLAFGLTCSLLISLWVWDEVSVDEFHANGENIYRVLGDVPNNGESKIRENVPSALAQPMLETFPEIQEITRVFRGQAVFESGETKFSESGIYADSSLLHIFSFPLKEGKLENILSGAESVVISERLAEKYFPGESALGKSISIVDKEKLNYVVTGVLKEIPTQSSLQFDFVLSYDQFEAKHRPWWNGKTNVHAFTNFNVEAYVSLAPGADPIQLNHKLQTFIHDYTNLETEDALFVFPFTEYYLHSDFSNGRIPTGKIQYVKLLSVIAFIVLLIACINFMNLSTARAGTRAKEVGVRKIIGAPRFQLLFQFIAESFVIVVIAMIFAIAAAHLLLPAFNLITQKQIAIPFASPVFIGAIISVAIGTGIFAGCYPAFHLSAFAPVKIFRSSGASKGGLSGIRNGLVVVQFTLSIIFIVFTIVVSNQIEFIQNKNLGIKKENIVQHALHGITKSKDAYRDELLNIPGVRSVGFSEHNPLRIENGNLGVSWEGMPDDEEIYFNVMQVGEGLVEIFDIQFVAGTDFPEKYSSEGGKYFIINEAAAKAMQAENPVGMPLRVWGFDGKVVGVARDFHHRSLMHAIEPVVLMYNPDEVFMAYIGIETNDTPDLLNQIQRVYQKYEPAYTFDYAFVEDQFNTSYRDVVTIKTLANLFSFAGIFISCLGLFGLSAFITEQRTKETGIRKVLGASGFSLLKLFSTGFIKLVLIAFVIATPVGWYYSTNWLSGYAYRIDIGVAPFVIAGCLALLIALLTVSYNTIRAANANPVDSLKYE